MEASTTPRMLSLEEVVRLTGLSDSTVRRRVRDGSIKAVQPGGRRTRLLFDAESIGGLLSPSSAPKDAEATKSPAAPKAIPGPTPQWRRRR
jgi:excisionase family DNA binding protein